jgi:bacterioferritin
MAGSAAKPGMETAITREKLIEVLNEDLGREYQAIISYVVYSQVLKGAEYMNIAAELEKHAQEELGHALVISKQIDYLGGMPSVQPKQVRTSDKAKEMLRFDLDNETETIRNYRERVSQCEALGEFAMCGAHSRDFDAGTGASDRPGDCTWNRRAPSETGKIKASSTESRNDVPALLAHCTAQPCTDNYQWSYSVVRIDGL